MGNKKKLWWLALPIGIAALWFCLVAYSNYIDPPLVDEYPKKSIKNEFMLYNDGCCFGLTDFSIWLSDENGEGHLLFNNAAPPYGKRLDANLPQDISGFIQAVVSFNYEYVTEGFVAFPIMDFESLDLLKKDGLLLIFGDGTLKVKSGRREALFSYDKAPWSDNLSVTKYSEATGKYYEETANGYKAAFYTKEEITIEKSEDWLASCLSTGVYYQYIYSDPDSWDMFIYFPQSNGGNSYNIFKFSVVDSIVNIYVTSDNSNQSTNADYFIIRVQAPLRGAWPNASELYIDGKKIEMYHPANNPQTMMTLEDVRALAAKGNSLTYADLDPFQAEPVLTGMYYLDFIVDGGEYQLHTLGAPPDDIMWARLLKRQADGSYEIIVEDIRNGMD